MRSAAVFTAAPNVARAAVRKLHIAYKNPSRIPSVLPDEENKGKRAEAGAKYLISEKKCDILCLDKYTLFA